MQLDTYAEFTAHENIQRRHTFARTLCADELYNVYYSGGRYDIDFVLSTATIVGPFPLVAIILAILIVRAVRRPICKAHKGFTYCEEYIAR